VIEFGGGRVPGIEIKSGAAPSRADGRHLEWLRDQLGERFVAGVVLPAGPSRPKWSANSPGIDRALAAPDGCLLAAAVAACRGPRRARDMSPPVSAINK
jgi:hypothetical protein